MLPSASFFSLQKILLAFLSHFDKIGVINQLTFITFKILRKISARVSEKTVSEVKVFGIIDDLGSHFKP